MKHKLLSILLCLAMALSLLPTAALAEGETGTTGTIITTSEELVTAIENAQELPSPLARARSPLTTTRPPRSP